MTKPLATYSFLPWLRQGIGSEVKGADGGGPAGSTRATVHVHLEVTGEPITAGPLPPATVDRDVEIYSPGDVVGIDARAIIRTEPRNWITNYEPNYLPAIEFYDEDFPWRYTPAGPDPARLQLRPWIALVILEEEVEFNEGTNLAGKPLPYIEVLDAENLPPVGELWAWAHVHVNQSLAANDLEFTSTDVNAVLPRMSAALATNRDLAYSRIVCPRRLVPNRAYHAFVVPVFETGRLAGLGLDPSTAAGASVSAWGPTGGVTLPVYYRWYFRTGGEGDFESLVRALKPQGVDHRVGVRDIDVRDPGPNLPGIDDADLGGILKLGGALRIPRLPEIFTQAELDEITHYEEWADVPAPPHPFQAALASFINLADDYVAEAPAAANAGSGLGPGVAGDADPLITAPLYARWHALVQRLLLERDETPVANPTNWVHELNLDPRHRTAAGFGTTVVQRHQEPYMDAAWSQIGDVVDANRRIRRAQLALIAADRWFVGQLQQLATVRPGRFLTLVAPAQRHLIVAGLTLHHARTLTVVTPALTSTVLRRVARPRGRLARSLPFDVARPPDVLVDRVAAGEVVVVPPKVTPPGVPTTEGLADRLLPKGVPGFVVARVRRFPWLWRLLVVLAVVVVVTVVVLAIAGASAPILAALAAFAVILLVVAAWLRRATGAIAAADAIREDSLTEDAVDDLPKSPDFVVVGAGTTPAAHVGATDSVQATRFKEAERAWRELHRASEASGTRPDPKPFYLDTVAIEASRALDPKQTIPRRTLTQIQVPARIRAQLVEEFGDVMAYPRIDEPMYLPLKGLSDDHFLPNLGLIPHNSITLLETNQPFIEAYMVGLNTEFGRELLWREYPTDQRPSTFRQFWDVRSVLDTSGQTEEQRREQLYDIPELHRWPRASALGDHDHREKPGDNEQEVVLVIRGELLKRYPNAVIYAHKAEWARTNGQIDLSQERTLAPLSDAEELKPPHEKLLTPLFEARVDPDISFFGFDLTAEEARGGSGEPGDEEAGWFFVIKERPGEPRFGFDIGGGQPIQTVNDLAWEDVAPGVEFVSANALAGLALAPLGPGEQEKIDQHADDERFLAAPKSSARWAYLLYQAPAMVAVHAAEVLKRVVTP